MNFIMQTISRKCAAFLWKPFRRPIHVRVRFAPSPTGYLHLGGLRTAIYNYLFAKKYNGKFILRIEDTDQSRLVSDATASLVEDLNWSGIKIDEGPTFGGSYGPYIQSQRLHIYNDGVEELLNNKSVYRCFCTEGRLDMLRKEALKQRQVPKYDNKCRNITPYEIKEKLLKGLPFCIRLKMNNYSDQIMDLIYGNVNIHTADSEGDPIIVKSDGYPTYHLANVVDDHMMKITHVFRGVEWQTSTIKHLLLYRAFGWNPPKYGHLPLLVNADGTKLSKRQGDISIKQFRERGIFPNALVNYVTSAGGGFERDEFKKTKIQTLSSLFKTFDIQNLTSHPSKLNPDLLNEFNNLEILRRLSHERESDELIEEVRRIVVFKHAVEPKSSYIRKVLYWSAKRITTLSELSSEKFMFLWVDCDPILTNKMTKDHILELITVLEKVDFAKNDIIQALKSYSKMVPMKFSDLMQILRRALSGMKDGPGVVEIMEMLGKETSLRRIRSNLKSNK